MFRTPVDRDRLPVRGSLHVVTLGELPHQIDQQVDVVATADAGRRS
jgi:hypothetical protein